jgi:hypothetical protein
MEEQPNNIEEIKRRYFMAYNYINLATDPTLLGCFFDFQGMPDRSSTQLLYS